MRPTCTDRITRAAVSKYSIPSQARPSHAHQGWRWALADAAVDLQAARLLVESAGARIDKGGDVQAGAAHAKVFATRMAGRHVAALMSFQ